MISLTSQLLQNVILWGSECDFDTLCFTQNERVKGWGVGGKEKMTSAIL